MPNESNGIKGVKKDTVNAFIRSMPFCKRKSGIINDKKLIPMPIGMKSIEKLASVGVIISINNALEIHNP